MKKLLLVISILCFGNLTKADYILIPMDYTQSEHLKAYGLAYWVLGYNVDVEWLLNYIQTLLNPV